MSERPSSSFTVEPQTARPKPPRDHENKTRSHFPSRHQRTSQRIMAKTGREWQKCLIASSFGSSSWPFLCPPSCSSTHSQTLTYRMRGDPARNPCHHHHLHHELIQSSPDSQIMHHRSTTECLFTCCYTQSGLQRFPTFQRAFPWFTYRGHHLCGASLPRISLISLFPSSCKPMPFFCAMLSYVTFYIHQYQTNYRKPYISDVTHPDDVIIPLCNHPLLLLPVGEGTKLKNGTDSCDVILVHELSCDLASHVTQYQLYSTTLTFSHFTAV